MSTLSTLEVNSLKGALEALLLVSSDPVSAPALAGALDIAPGECASLLAELKVEYEEANRGFQLREVAGGWRLFTRPAYHDVVEAYVLSWDTQKLSQAALETLAVIAYHQPVTREVIKGIRGVNSDGVIASLVDKGLVRELGRDPQRGQAIIYGTTNAFLEKFGLRSTRDLPDLEQFAPDEQSRQFIRERLSGRSIQSTLEEQAEDLDEERELLVAAEHAEPNELTVAADTIVTFDGKILGKPATEDEARTMLRELSGRTHQVATGVCIVKAGDTAAPHAAESLSFVDVTDVTFYELTDEQIEHYVASGEPMDKAGAYGIQGTGGRMLVHDISGDFYNVVGLPIARVARAIQKLS